MSVPLDGADTVDKMVGQDRGDRAGDTGNQHGGGLPGCGRRQGQQPAQPEHCHRQEGPHRPGTA
ncbi:MAG TPA: hypothetical protein VJ735_03990 [Actinomycetes bacterium]|nr:hypothetical protein [Actinomycetes bacterium]